MEKKEKPAAVSPSRPQASGQAGKLEGHFMAHRYGLFLIAIFVNSFGIAAITKALLGTSPITSVNYVLSMFTPLTMGQWTIVVNLLFVVVQPLLMSRTELRKDLRMYLLQIPITLCFGTFIDISMQALWWVDPSGNYLLQLLSLAIGCFILAVGIAIEVKADAAMLAGEYMVRVLSKRLRREFGYVKLGFDVSLVALACLLSLVFMGEVRGVREGTVVAALVVGPIVHFISPAFRVFDRWIGTGLPAEAVAAVGMRAPAPVITIAREYGSGGHRLGEELARRLGISYYDSELIALAARESGLSEQYVSANEQSISPLWLKNLFTQDYESPVERSLSSRDALFVAQSRVVRRLANEGSCVIIGRCADYVLADDPQLVRVFCYSDLDSARRRCTEQYGIAPDRAEAEIKRVNAARVAHYEYYTGRHWADPHHYDLMLNMGVLDMGSACDIVEKLYRLRLDRRAEGR